MLHWQEAQATHASQLRESAALRLRRRARRAGAMSRRAEVAAERAHRAQQLLV